jgi:hypothetical protein
VVLLLGGLRFFFGGYPHNIIGFFLVCGRGRSRMAQLKAPRIPEGTDVTKWVLAVARCVAMPLLWIYALVASIVHSLRSRAWTNNLTPAARRSLEHAPRVPPAGTSTKAVAELFDRGFTTFDVLETNTEKLEGLDQREFRARVTAYDFGTELKEEFEKERKVGCIFRFTQKRCGDLKGLAVHTDGFYVASVDTDPKERSLAGLFFYALWVFSFYHYWGTTSHISKDILASTLKKMKMEAQKCKERSLNGAAYCYERWVSWMVGEGVSESNSEELFQHVQINVWVPCNENKRLMVISRYGFRRLHAEFGDGMFSGHRSSPGRFDFAHLLQPALNWLVANGDPGDVYVTKPMQGIVFCSEGFSSDIATTLPADTHLGDKFFALQHAGYVVDPSDPAGHRSVESRYLMVGPVERCSLKTRSD